MGVVRHRFTTEEYRKMGEAGILHEDDRVELVGGEIVEMSAIEKRHFESVYRLTRLLSRWVFLDAPSRYGAKEAARLGVSVQNPLAVTGDDEPQPNLVLTPAEALLVVEVADTSLRCDRETKLPLYAAVGIPESWLVDLSADLIEAYHEPGPDGYKRTVRFGRGEQVVAISVPNLAFDASDALPPEL